LNIIPHRQSTCEVVLANIKSPGNPGAYVQMLDCELGMVHKWFTFTSHKILEGSCVIPHFGGLTSEFCCCSMWTSKVSRLKKQGINQHTHAHQTQREKDFKALVNLYIFGNLDVYIHQNPLLPFCLFTKRIQRHHQPHISKKLITLGCLGSGEMQGTIGKHPVMRKMAVQPSSNEQLVTLETNQEWGIWAVPHD